MAPLAPIDGTPTREKLPPRTLLQNSLAVCLDALNMYTPKDTSRKVQEEESSGAHLFLDLMKSVSAANVGKQKWTCLRGCSQLSQHVEEEVNDASVQKNGRDKSFQ